MPRLDHVNIETRDAGPMIAFLETVLGASEGPRPPFRRPGHWLYLDGQPVIHLNVVQRDGNCPAGIINHAAFGPYDFHQAVEKIRATGYAYELKNIPETDIGQIFVDGPEGLRIELQYRLEV
jgi:catechol 2,3-dioxygenase-like lactoylglutathione lyase family enzyme